MPNSRPALMELNSPTFESPNNQQNISLVWVSNSPSPDEEIIRQRGRRKAAQIANANMQALTPPKTPRSSHIVRTPSKSCVGTPVKNLPTRTSPRKRLNLGYEMTKAEDTPALLLRTRKNCSPCKRARLQYVPKRPVNVEIAINALSQSQLVEMMQKLMESHPEIKQEINNIIPDPDIRPLESKLSYLHRNIMKSISRNLYWGSDKDVYCYRHVCSHLDLFKKECFEEIRHLVSGHQWKTVIDYVFMAWKYVCKLPDWEDKAHNKIKEQCFRYLTNQCMNAIKKGYFETDDLEIFSSRLKNLVNDNNCISPCLEFIENQLRK